MSGFRRVLFIMCMVIGFAWALGLFLYRQSKSLQLLTNIKSHQPVIIVEPGTIGTLWLIIGAILALSLGYVSFFIRGNKSFNISDNPMMTSAFLAFMASLAVCSLYNDVSASGTFLQRVLETRGYIHCTAKDEIRYGRMQVPHKAEAWTLPESCR